MGSGQSLKVMIFYIPAVISSSEVSSVTMVSFLLTIPTAITFKKENYFNQNFKLVNFI